MLNINNGNGNDCLELHLIASIMNEHTRPVKNMTRPGQYRAQKNRIIIPPNVSYPASLKDLEQYEQLNNIAVNIYRLSKLRGSRDGYMLALVRLSEYNKEGVRVVSLLKLNKNHVCLIKDLNTYIHGRSEQKQL